VVAESCTSALLQRQTTVKGTFLRLASTVLKSAQVHCSSCIGAKGEAERGTFVRFGLYECEPNPKLMKKRVDVCWMIIIYMLPSEVSGGSSTELRDMQYY
jgi:hypothetical protein